MKRFFSIGFLSFCLLALCACASREAASPPDKISFSAAASTSSSLETPEEPVEPAKKEDIPKEAHPLSPEELAAAEIDHLLSSMTMEEKVGQLFFVRVPIEKAEEDIAAYHLGGYILFGRDTKDKTAGDLIQTIHSYQAAARSDTGIPMLIGVDEEGGSVVRVSSNPHLRSAKFPSPQWLWNHQHDHGNIFAEDAWEKSNLLLALGFNVNLAPVCDVSTNPGDFIYSRTLGQDAVTTAQYAFTVVNAMSEAGIGSVLKHFPGYGNNIDTHTGIAVDNRPMESFTSGDFLPFQAGITAGQACSGQQTAVMVSHNIVTSMDDALPASLSPEVHRILRQELDFHGVIMTDDLAMDAVAAYAENGDVAVMALHAGNDLIITTDYQTQIPKVLEALRQGRLDAAQVDAACRRVLIWKQSLGLL